MPSLESGGICGDRRLWRGGGKSVFSVEVVVVMAVLVVVVPVLVVMPVLVPMVVVTTTFSLHELHDSVVMVSFFVSNVTTICETMQLCRLLLFE
jgi:hypothetical protein